MRLSLRIRRQAPWKLGTTCLAATLLSCAGGSTPAAVAPTAQAPGPRGGVATSSVALPAGVRRVLLCGQSIPINAVRFACDQLDFEDLAPLAEFEELRELDLAQSGVTDLRALASRVQLRRLDLESTDVTDLAPLAGLKHLRRLRFSYRTTMVTGQPRVLTALNRPTPKIDLSPLSQLAQLEHLVLGEIAVESLEPIRAASGLRRLGLLSVEAPPGALTKLQGLSALERVVLFNAPCRELGALAGSPGMKELFVHRCRRTDLRPLSALTELEHLTLSSVEGRGARVLSALTQLRVLDIAAANFDDYSFLSALSALVSLDASQSTLTNLAPLSRLPQLRELDAAGTKITRLDALNTVKSLRSVTLSGDSGHAYKAPTEPDRKLDTAVKRLRIRRPELQIRYRDPSVTALVRTPAIWDD